MVAMTQAMCSCACLFCISRCDGVFMHATHSAQLLAHSVDVVHGLLRHEDLIQCSQLIEAGLYIVTLAVLLKRQLSKDHCLLAKRELLPALPGTALMCWSWLAVCVYCLQQLHLAQMDEC